MKIKAKLVTLFLSTTLLAPLGVSADTVLNFWSWRPQEVSLWERVNREQLLDGVEINFQVLPADDYDTRLRTALQSGDGPDVFHGRAGANWLDVLVNAKVLEPLPSNVDVDLVLPASLSAVTGSDGNVYGVPFAVQLQSVIYNKGVLADLGVEVPTNMTEFTVLLHKAKEAGLFGMAVGARSGWWNNQVLNEVLMAGMLSDDFQSQLVAGTSCFTDSAFVNALSTFQSWQPYFNPAPTADDYGAMRTMVALGEAAMMIDGAWSTTPASPMFELDPDLEMGFFPIPGANNRAVAHPDGGYLVNARSDNKDAAYQLLQLATSKGFAAIFAEEVGEMPAVQGLEDMPNERMMEVAATLFRTASVEPFVAYSLNAGKPSYAELTASGYQELLLGDISAEQFAYNIQAGLNSWGYVGAQNCAL